LPPRADVDVRAGRSLTDLPLRQCYYWPTGASTPQRRSPGLVMAYDDLLNVSFWSGLDLRREVHKAGLSVASPYQPPHRRQDWPLYARTTAMDAVAATADPFAERLQRNWHEHSATEMMVRELHRQLMLMHGVDTAPEPCDAAYMDWSRDPYGGGVHFWNVNYESDKMVGVMSQPVDGFPCYICGEAYSTKQTWVEGALQTAEIVLRARLGLPKAEWQAS
jgi:hypothetical protein